MAEMQVSTQTFVIYSSLKNLDLRSIFNQLELTEEIVGAKFELDSKGECKPISKLSKNFLKCLTMTILLHDGKKLSVKLFCNGSIQITGCKIATHAIKCAEILLESVSQSPVESFFLLSVMLNVNFSVGFNINREKLGQYIYSECDLNIPPLTMGYMGLKLKFPVANHSEIKFDKYQWAEGIGSEKVDTTTFADYFAGNKKKLAKKYFISVEIFQNGKVLISGVDWDAILPVKMWIENLLEKTRKLIEIKPVAKKTFLR